MTNVDDELRQLRAEAAQLREELQRLKQRTDVRSQTILGITDLILAVDATRTLKYLNTAAERHFGRAREDVVGSALGTLVSPDLRGPLLENLITEADAQGGSLVRSAIFRVGDESKAYEIRVSRSADGHHVVVSDRSELHRVRAVLSRYVSPAVADDVLAAGIDPFHARKYPLTVLFADLRGFTAMSSTIPAERVKRLIDEYLTVQIDIVLGAGATVDKIVGDEVMALFGAPIPKEDHALWGVNTALLMQRGHAALLDTWRARGEPACKVGIGVHSGEMVVGNIGSSKRMDYTVIGHNVNLAARLCSAAEGDEILISPMTLAEVERSLAAGKTLDAPVTFRKGRTVNAKGIPEPVETVVVSLTP